MIAFRCELPEEGTFEQFVAGLREDGFVRAIVDGRIVNLDEVGEGRDALPIIITGSEFGVDWSVPTTRATMLPRLLRTYQGKQYVNRDLNIPIIVGKRGIKKVLSHLPDAKPAMALAKLPELLESAAWDRDDVPREPDQNIRKWHYLKSAVLLDGRRHLVEIKVREDGSGHWFYDQHLMLQKKEDSPYKPGTSERRHVRSLCRGTSAGESSPNGIIGRNNKKVKREKKPLATEDNATGADFTSSPPPPSPLIYVIVDRLRAGSASDSRLRDSLETAFTKGRGRCSVFVEENATSSGEWRVESGEGVEKSPNLQISKSPNPQAPLAPCLT
jgi:hypothetical protein